jgi:hypothetical protein
MAVLLSSRTWFSRPERSQPERTRREDRHSKFYEISDNLRRIAPSGLHAIAYFDPQGVFVIRYLMTLPAAAGQDFGVSDDKVEDLSQLDDHAGGDEEQR